MQSSKTSHTGHVCDEFVRSKTLLLTVPYMHCLKCMHVCAKVQCSVKPLNCTVQPNLARLKPKQLSAMRVEWNPIVACSCVCVLLEPECGRQLGSNPSTQGFSQGCSTANKLHEPMTTLITHSCSSQRLTKSLPWACDGTQKH